MSVTAVGNAHFGSLASIGFEHPEQALAVLLKSECTSEQYTAWNRARDQVLTAAAEKAGRAAASPNGGKLTCRIAKSGGVSVYGLGRWPTTLYAKPWKRLADFMPEVLKFIAEHESELSAGKDDARFVKEPEAPANPA